MNDDSVILIIIFIPFIVLLLIVPRIVRPIRHTFIVYSVCEDQNETLILDCDSYRYVSQDTCSSFKVLPPHTYRCLGSDPWHFKIVHDSRPYSPLHIKPIEKIERYWGALICGNRVIEAGKIYRLHTKPDYFSSDIYYETNGKLYRSSVCKEY